MGRLLDVLSKQEVPYGDVMPYLEWNRDARGFPHLEAENLGVVEENDRLS